jgi:hypothetical protein
MSDAPDCMEESPAGWYCCLSKGHPMPHVADDGHTELARWGEPDWMALCARLAEALRLFVDGYPDPEWRFMLHEEGCDGTRLLPAERDENEAECQCDGDEAADLVSTALAEYGAATRGTP